jgi:GTP cyclohydrolase II
MENKLVLPKPEKVSTELATVHGDFEFIGYFWSERDDENLLVVAKRPFGDDPIVRVQSACYSGEIFESLDCDCHEQLVTSLARIASEGGLLVYQLRDGRGAGLKTKLTALEMWRTLGVDTADAYKSVGVPVDPRDYAKVSYVLHDLGVSAVRLLTNNPRKITGLQTGGLIVSREPLEIAVDPTSEKGKYLKTKAEKLGHLIRQFK